MVVIKSIPLSYDEESYKLALWQHEKVIHKIEFWKAAFPSGETHYFYVHKIQIEWGNALVVMNITE